MPLSARTGAQPLSAAISPCPNDTFSFYHFFNDSATKDLYEPHFYDIEELNRQMVEGRWDITKASFPAFLRASERYELMDSGAAIGFGVGPIVVFSSEKIYKKSAWVVGLPGENTTAGFLWKYFLKHSNRQLPEKIEVRYLNFADVLKKTAAGELDAGVVIHEGRFVYRAMGLHLMQDLGEFWQQSTGGPVPLGGIFIKKDLAPEVKIRAARDLKNSVSMALEEKKIGSDVYTRALLPYIRSQSQELDLAVIEQHIEYYVNGETVELSPGGMDSINMFLKIIKDFNQ